MSHTPLFYISPGKVDQSVFECTGIPCRIAIEHRICGCAVFLQSSRGRLHSFGIHACEEKGAAPLFAISFAVARRMREAAPVMEKK